MYSNIVITRPEPECTELCRLLVNKGISRDNVIPLPLQQVKLIQELSIQQRDLINSVINFNHNVELLFIITSKRGVDALILLLKKFCLLPTIESSKQVHKIKFIVQTEKIGKYLNKLLPYSSKDLVKWLIANVTNKSNYKVVIVTSELSSNIIYNECKINNFDVELFYLYTMQELEINSDCLKNLNNNSIVVFFSPSAVSCWEKNIFKYKLSEINCVTFGNVTSAKVTKLGGNILASLNIPTLDELADYLVKIFNT
jgi:hypothetical protein